MKIRAKANGNVIDADDGAAQQLIDAGIYEAYDEKAEKKAAKAAPAEPQKLTKDSSTAVRPMGTSDIPKAPKRGKPIK